MFHTFSLKGTKDGLELEIKETDQTLLLYKELEECFRLSNEQIFPVASIKIEGKHLSPLVLSTVEHLILKASGGRLIPNAKIKNSKSNHLYEIAIQKSVRSGEYVEGMNSLLIEGNINSGGIVQAQGLVIILGSLFGTVIVPENQKIYVGKKCNGQVRIGEHIYVLNLEQKNGVWLHEREGKLYFEEHGGNIIHG